MFSFEKMGTIRSKKFWNYGCPRMLLVIVLICFGKTVSGQGHKLTSENISRSLEEWSQKAAQDPLRPAYHLTPPGGSMGDPNGAIYHDGWYHMFYGLNPFSSYPGGWYWAHVRSRDLLHWEHLPPNLTPAFELGLNHVGSGSTIVTPEGKRLAFYSTSKDGSMKFWQAQMGPDLNSWTHDVTEPVLTLDHPGLPPFDTFWRDPFVFAVEGRTFLIACADLFEEDYVPVPIFEAANKELTDWVYKGELFRYPKHKTRNLEVPGFRPLGDKWILMASSDAPVDRCVYFIGDFDLETLRFTPESEGNLDHSGHFYAQESILDDQGDLYVMAWIPGWDRDWLPTLMNHPLKNDSPLWNGCFSIPRKLKLENDGTLIQQPVVTMQQLRGRHRSVESRDLPVTSAFTAIDVLEDIQGDQLELQVVLDLNAASMVGLNVLSDDKGIGGLPLVWSGDRLHVDGIDVPMPDWQPGEDLEFQLFIDQHTVEIFVNGGRYCVSRKVRAEHIKGDRIALTRLGGTARLVSLEAWDLKAIN